MKNFIFIIFIFINVGTYAQQPNDCVNAIVVCGSGAINSNASGAGAVNEVSGCGSTEHNSVWIRIDIVQAGTLGFDIIPDNTNITVDYDFWVYGPNEDCNNFTEAIRCSTTNPQASGATHNNTGMSLLETDYFEGPGPQGNGYVSALDVQVGEFYYIVVDRPIGLGGFSLNWIGTASQGSGAFPSPPAANPIANIETCSNNGLASFDLGGLRNTINPSNQVDVDFFESLANAVDGEQALPDSYTSTTSLQSITAKVTDQVSQCTNYVEFYLIINSAPEVNVTPTQIDLCTPREVEVNFNSSANTQIDFLVDSQPHQVTTDALGNVTYSFTPTQNSTIELVEASQLENGLVLCTAENLNQTIAIEFNGLPDIENLIDLNNCDDNADGKTNYNFTINTNTVYSQFNEDTFEVLYFETQQNAEQGVNAISNPTQYENTVNLPQTIWVKVQEIAHPDCYTIANFNLTAYTDAAPIFTVIKQNTGLDETKKILITNITGIGPYEFRINDEEWVPLPNNQSTLTFNAIGNKTNIVQGRHTQGCGETIIPVTFINYPKFFTPNYDGINDYWNITGLSDENLPAKIRIFDRFGKLLTILKPNRKGWDGNYGKKQMPANDYWFYLEYFETTSTGERVKRVFKKNFTLLR